MESKYVNSRQCFNSKKYIEIAFGYLKTERERHCRVSAGK
jgi:hypothetical protein